MEWIALVLLASLAAVALGVALGSSLPGGELARAIASRVLCAVRLSGSCERGSHALVAEYGPEVAALVREHAPTIHYGDGAQYLPVDHRPCRRAGCAVASGAGAAWRTRRGLPATAFTRVVDCRSPAPRPAAPASCAGRREGNLYLQ